MPGFRFTLNQRTVAEPIGFDEFTESVVLDAPRRTLRFEYPLTLTFYGDATDIITDVFESDVNASVELDIRDDRQGADTLIARCRITAPNCTWNLTRRTVEVDIDEATYQGRIFDNLDREIQVGHSETLSGHPYTPTAQPVDVTFFDFTTGGDAGTFAAWDAMKVIADLVAILSDLNVTTASDWYDNLETKPFITLGRLMRYETDAASAPEAPTVTLGDVFENIAKKYNLWLIVTNPLTSPVLRIEHEDYLRRLRTGITAENVRDMTRSYDFETLYGSVAVGSDDFIEDLDSDFNLPRLTLYAFAEENFTVSGNLTFRENELNLVSDFVIDSNVIQSVAGAGACSENGGKCDYDTDIFLLAVMANMKLHQSEFGALPIANAPYLNSEVLDRYRFPGDITAALAGTDPTDFGANDTGAHGHNPPNNIGDGIILMPERTLEFPNVVTDPGNNYDPGDSVYTAPVTGVYRFEAVLRFQLTAVTQWFNDYTSWRVYYPGILQFTFPESDLPPEAGIPATFDFFLHDFRSIGGGAFLPIGSGIYSSQWGDHFENAPYMTLSSHGFYDDPHRVRGRHVILARARKTIALQAGDKVAVEGFVNADAISSLAELQSHASYQDFFFGLIESPYRGGTFVSGNPTATAVNLLTADNTFIPEAQWATMRADPTSAIILTADPERRFISHAKHVDRNFTTGETSIRALYAIDPNAPPP